MGDAAGHAEARAAYLTDALRMNDVFFAVDTLNAVARARGLDVIAAATGFSLVELERSLSSDGQPDLSVFIAVIGALGLRLAVVPV